MKRLTSIALCLILALSCVACASAAETREELLAEHATLTLMGRDNYYSGAPFTDGLGVFKAIEEAMNVTIEWELVPSSQYGDVLQTRLAAATDLPDIINANAVSDPSVYGVNGIFIALEDLINEVNTPNYIAFLEKVPLMAGLQTSTDGHQYQFSGYCGRGEMEGGSYGLTLRGDWLERLGLEVPTTTEEYYEVLKAFKEQDANGNGDADDEIPLSDKYDKMHNIASAFGANTRNGIFDVDADGNVFFVYASEQYRDFLRFINKLYAEGLLDPEFATTDDDQVEAAEAQNIIGGRASLWVDEMPFSEQMIQSADPNGYYLFVDPLTGPNGTQGKVFTSGTLDGAMAISKDCEDPARALAFLDYMIFDEYITICNNCGEEGVCWEYDEGDAGSFHFTDYVTANAEGLSPMEAIRSTGGYHTFPFVVLGEGRLLMNAVSDRVVGYINSLAEYIEDKTEYAPSTAEEATRANELARDIKVLYDESMLLFMTGELDLEADWEDYVGNLEALNVAEYVAIYQARYDRLYK